MGGAPRPVPGPFPSHLRATHAAWRGSVVLCGPCMPRHVPVDHVYVVNRPRRPAGGRSPTAPSGQPKKTSASAYRCGSTSLSTVVASPSGDPRRCRCRAARPWCPSRRRAPRRSRAARTGSRASGRAPSAYRRAGCDPSTVVRASLPVRFSISFSSTHADAAEAHVPERVELAVGQRHRPLGRRRALGHDDDRRVVRLEARSTYAHDLLDVERHLRDRGSRWRRRPCPACSAIQPACRPITSTMSARWCDSAVVCSRSIASIAMLTAVSKPNVKSVALRSLSIVFGTPTTCTPCSCSRVATPSVSSPPIATSASTPSAAEVGLDLLDAALDLERVGPRRAEDRAAAGQDAAHLAGRRAAS